MTRHQLLILDAMIKAGNFNATSAMLHRSQPSLSMVLKKLEEWPFGSLHPFENHEPKTK